MDSSDIQFYYTILEITEKDSVSTLKAAYRKKAKQYHPDVNKNPGAHDTFLEIAEAYEYLLALKTGKIKTPSPQTYETYEEHAARKREEARERARAYASMKYEAYINSKDYKVVSAIETIETYLLFFFCLLIVSTPFILLYAYSWGGFLVGLAFALVMSPLWVYVFRDVAIPEISKVSKALRFLFSLRIVRFALITMVNLLVVLKIGLQTLLPFPLLLLLIAIASAVVFIRSKKKGFSASKRNYYSFALAPLMITGLLLLNFFFAYNPVKESYNFVTEMQYVSSKSGRGGWQRTTLIRLENGVYEDYTGLRLFLIYEEMAHSSNITYTFKTGLLGIRVMSTYHFN